MDSNYQKMKTLIEKYLPYLIVLLLIAIFVQGFFNVPKGISESEMNYRLKNQELIADKLVLLKENQKLEVKLNFFKDEILKINSTVDSATIDELENMFANYFQNR